MITQRRELAVFLLIGLWHATTGCGANNQMPWEHPSIAKIVPSTALPLTPPSLTMRADKGPARATYPLDYTATIKPDGKIQFPQGTDGRLKDGTITAGASVVATVTWSGEVSGRGLKHRYHFTADGDLVDEDGHGVRVSPEGGVRALGGPYHYQDVMVWAPEGGAAWRGDGWHAIAIISLIVIENLLPTALRP